MGADTPVTPAGGRRAVAVIRVSRRKGREGSAFMSPEQQRDLISAWVAANGWTVVAWVDETDSVSGKTTDRAGLQQALALLRDGHADGLIVAKVDRFSRTLVEGLLAVRELNERGQAFVAVANNVNSVDPKDRMGNLLLTLLLMFAEWQLATLTDGWDDVRRRHIAGGISNIAPTGYTRDPETRRLVIDPTTAPYVREMFARRAAGESWQSIADWATAEDVPRMRGGTRWAHSGVKRVVENRTYLGELRSGDIVNASAHPAIVSRAQWDAANRAHRAPARSSDRPDVQPPEYYLLQGIARCATCGGTLRGNTDRRLRTYRCGRKHTWGTCPRPARTKADDLERLVVERFHADFLADDRPLIASESTGDLDRALAEVAAAEDELTAFTSAANLPMLRKRMGEAWVDAAIAERLDLIDAARERVASLRHSAMGLQMPDRLSQIWPVMEPEDRRELIGLAYPVVAVAPAPRPDGGRRGLVVPVAERCHVFAAHDADLPTDLLGPRKVGVRPIRWADGPGSTGMSAGQPAGNPVVD